MRPQDQFTLFWNALLTWWAIEHFADRLEVVQWRRIVFIAVGLAGLLAGQWWYS
jgi:hypothetical protein